MSISFNVAPYTEDIEKSVAEVIESHHICGDGPYTKKCNEWMERRFNAGKVMLTTSGTSALNMAVMMCGLEPGDEMILPSYTFSSTANAVILGGGVPVFVDIRQDTMNIDESMIEAAITARTKGIIVVHYAGVACEMDTIMDIARRHGLKVIEDAAQAMMSTYKGKYLGTIGDFGCYSFHETKNFSMGEGGAIVINDDTYNERAEIIREKGTDRSKFYRGEIDKYTWVEKGDSFLPSELNAAYLYPQLLRADDIISHRVRCWNKYYEKLLPLARKRYIELPGIPKECIHNGHMFYIKNSTIEERAELMKYLRDRDIETVFHYIPLHSAPAGIRYGRFSGDDVNTTKESKRLLRLPLHRCMTADIVEKVADEITGFYKSKE